MASRGRMPRLAGSTSGSALPLVAMRFPLERLRRGWARTDVFPTHDPLGLAPAPFVEDADRGVRTRGERSHEHDPAHGETETTDGALERESERGQRHGTDVIHAHTPAL